jgi:hypothetical protein
MTDKIKKYIDGMYSCRFKTEISNSTHQQLAIQKLSIDNMEIAVESACDQVIKLIVQCDELTREVSSINLLQEQIAQIKRSVGSLEETII